LCTVCGAVTTPAKLEHIAHADDGDCTTSITCTERGRLMIPAQEHNINGDFTKAKTADMEQSPYRLTILVHNAIGVRFL